MTKKKKKKYSHFQTGTTNNKKLFQISNQTILTISGSYYQKLLHTFSYFVSNNTYNFRKLLPNKSKHIFRASIKHSWHTQRVTKVHTPPEIKKYRHFQSITSERYYKLFIMKQYWDIQRVFGGKQYYISTWAGAQKNWYLAPAGGQNTKKDLW